MLFRSKNVEKPSKARQGNKAKETEHCNSRCENFARWKPTYENAYQGANSLNGNFAHHCSRCENFRTVRNSLLAHECHFAHLKPLFAPCETRCEIFAQCEIECEMQSKVRNSQFKVRKFRTVQFKVRKFCTVILSCENS